MTVICSNNSGNSLHFLSAFCTTFSNKTDGITVSIQRDIICGGCEGGNIGMDNVHEITDIVIEACILLCITAIHFIQTKQFSANDDDTSARLSHSTSTPRANVLNAMHETLRSDSTRRNLVLVSRHERINDCS